jgi:hypothetical protein
MARRSYRSIPNPTEGRTFLTIHEPGDLSPEQTGYVVAVGGKGVGRAATLVDAQALLLDQAKLKCQAEIGEAQRVLQHFQGELQRLNTGGLGAEVPGTDTQTLAGR